MLNLKKKNKSIITVVAILILTYFVFLLFSPVPNTSNGWLVESKAQNTLLNSIDKHRLNRLLRILYQKEYYTNLTAELGVLSLKLSTNLTNNPVNKLFNKEINEYLDILDNDSPWVNDKFINTLNNISNYYLSNSNIHTFNQRHNSKMVIVTASDSFFYGRLLATIKSVHEYFPKNIFIIYDLGMTPSMIEKILRNCKCSIRSLHVNYRKHFPHLDNLKNYAWKPLVIADVMKYYEQIMYIDASIRFKSTDASDLIDKSSQTGVVASYIGFRLPCFTHPNAFKWFGETSESYDQVGTIEGNFIIFNRNFLTALILKAWVTCALDESCIAPKGARLKGCCGCHRFDQSVITIINSFFFQQQSVYSFNNNLYNIKRVDPYKYF